MSDEIIQADFNSCDDLLCSEEGRGDFIKDNIERLSVWKESAEAGDARGQLLYGLCFFYGHGVEESDEVAVDWFQKAAEQGNAQAQCSLGLCYENGWGVEKNKSLSVELFKKAAAQGHSQAIENLPLLAKIELGLESHKVLTKEIAEQLLEDEFFGDLSEFTKIEDGAASVLATFTGEEESPEDETLYLDALCELSGHAASELGQFPGSFSLNGLKALDKRVAEHLSSSNVSLSLAGISSISDEDAKHLCKCKNLNLSGIENLSDSAATELGRMEGERLSLCGLSDVSDTAISHLSKANVEELELGGENFVLSESSSTQLSGSNAQCLYVTTRSITDATAEGLSQFEGYLGIFGLTGLSDSAAEALTQHSGELSVNLEHLSNSAIAILKTHPSLAPKILTQEIAEQFLADEDSVDLEDFDEIEDKAAEMLSKHQGDLWLGGLKSMSDAGAESLSKHEGDLSMDLDNVSESAAAILRKHPSFADED